MASNARLSQPSPVPPPATPSQVAYPPPNAYDAYRRIAAEQRSFTTPAVLTLVLYIVLWLPGLIANIVYWVEANNVERQAGRAPEGKGCLVALFWVCGVVPSLLLICVFLSLLGALF